MNEVVVLADRRRTLTARGAAVRQRLLELTTAIISRDGYAATTLQKLSDEAKLGRGSVLHQFPTRHDLMVEVTRYIGQQLLANLDDHFGVLSDPWAKLHAYPDYIWANANTVPGQALAEIAFAARWDTGLDERIGGEIGRMNASLRSFMRQTCEMAGIQNSLPLIGRLQLLIAAAHGLVLDRYLHHDDEIVQSALTDLKKDFLRYLAELRVDAEIAGAPHDNRTKSARASHKKA